MTVWGPVVDEVAGVRGRRLHLTRGARPATFSEVLYAWQRDAACRTCFMQALTEMPFIAFRWEMPPLTRDSLDQPFECVVTDSPELVVPADARPFSAQLAGAADADVMVFDNLGGDAVLVVPCAVAGDAAYAHLASFCRQAPASQQHHLWAEAGAQMTALLGRRPLWLNTAGGGVAWLHVRIDQRPKYYVHAPYAY